jgi:type I restriction enzyme M protein
VVWVPKVARWEHLQANAPQPTIGKLIDEAMVAIEKDKPVLKGVLPKDDARPWLDKHRLGELINLIGTIGLGDAESRSKDILGRVYEYFLGRFANAEGKGGGEFYTPQCVVRVLVEMIEPYKGRIYDPCCGSGGMFVHKDLKANFILANPPFNVSDWGGDRLREDARWKYGTPPVGNANFAWVQHMVHHLAPSGIAGFVLANGSMSSNQSGEGEIRRKMIEADLVDCMIGLPGQLFYTTQIPACLWFLTRS